MFLCYIFQHIKYKDTQLKNSQMQPIADRFEHPLASLFTKIKGYKDRVSYHMRKERSGAGAIENLTPRDQFIVQHFSFLRPHIHARPTRETIRTNPLPAAQGAAPRDSADELEDETYEDQEADPDTE